MKSYTIYFLRHGITEASNTGQYIGSTDLPLTEKGKQSLLHFRKTYNYPKANLYYTSPLIRCVETMKILYPQSNPTVINGLAECDFGMWEGRTAKELSHIPMFQDFISGKNNVSPPKGESSHDFVMRIASTFETIVNMMLKSGQESSVIVTHAGVIGTLLSLYGLPRAMSHEWLCEPGHGFAVRIMPSLWSRDKVVEVFSRVPFLTHGNNDNF